MIELGLVKTGHHSVRWKANSDSGLYELVVQDHDVNMLEQSLVSYILPGAGVTATWFTGSRFDGTNGTFNAQPGSSHPDLTRSQSGIANDNIHSLILETTRIERVVRPRECEIYSELREALLRP